MAKKEWAPYDPKASARRRNGEMLAWAVEELEAGRLSSKLPVAVPFKNRVSVESMVVEIANKDGREVDPVTETMSYGSSRLNLLLGKQEIGYRALQFTDHGMQPGEALAEGDIEVDVRYEGLGLGSGLFGMTPGLIQHALDRFGSLEEVDAIHN